MAQERGLLQIELEDRILKKILSIFSVLEAAS